jgi:DNA-binding IclR family transcriptional regulator
MAPPDPPSAGASASPTAGPRVVSAPKATGERETSIRRGSPRELAVAVAAARVQGYVVVDEEFEPDLVGVAVPVRDGGGAVIASLNVSAPRFRFIDRVTAAAQELPAVSGQLARALGNPAAVQAPAQPPRVPAQPPRVPAPA